MPQDRIVGNNIYEIGKKVQQTDEEIINEIRELRRKIRIEGKRLASQKIENEETIAKYDAKILEMRSDISLLRDRFRKALDADEIAVSVALSDRKRQHLAMRGMSGEEARKKLDQNVCDLAKRVNELLHTKKKREQRLSDLRKQMFFMVQGDDVESNFSSRARQLENSINKVNLKKESAIQMNVLYSKIRRGTEDQLKAYPKLLDDLEKQIQTQRTEIPNLREMQQTATSEGEVALKSVNELETTVKEERRKREVVIRRMRSQVIDLAGISDLTHTKARPSRKSKEEQGLQQTARRTLEMLDKIKEYEKKAIMLELVSGIPFSNKEHMVNCFRKQKISSRALRVQTRQKRKAITKKKKELEDCRAAYDQMLYQHQRELEEKIDEAKRVLEDVSNGRERNSKADYEARHLLTTVRSWLAPIASRLLRSCENLQLEKMEAQLQKADEYLLSHDSQQINVEKLFPIFAELLIALHRKAYQMPLDISCKDEDVTCNNEEVFLSARNNRILFTAERRVSEDFDYPYCNGEYLSRAAIKYKAGNKRRNR